MARSHVYCNICRHKMPGKKQGDCDDCKQVFVSMALVHDKEKPEHNTPDRQRALAATTVRIQGELARLDAIEAERRKLPAITSRSRARRLQRAKGAA